MVLDKRRVSAALDPERFGQLRRVHLDAELLKRRAELAHKKLVDLLLGLQTSTTRTLPFTSDAVCTMQPGDAVLPTSLSTAS
jgi:hypothetical protein